MNRLLEMRQVTTVEASGTVEVPILLKRMISEIPIKKGHEVIDPKLTVVVPTGGDYSGMTLNLADEDVHVKLSFKTRRKLES